MKIYHFALIFLLIIITTIVITDIKTNDLKAVAGNKSQIDRYLDVAIDDGVTRLVQVDSNDNVTISLDAAAKSFFLSLYSSFGILSDSDMQEKLNAYIPVMAVTTEDGYYVFYSGGFTRPDGYTYVAKTWTEKMPYYYEDGDFIYGFTLGDTINLYDKNNLLGGSGSEKTYRMDYRDIQTEDCYASFRTARPDSFLLDDKAFVLIRKGSIINCIEDTLAYYTSHHNRIAARYGITYNFSLPEISDDEWAPYLDDVSLFVVFQGYPYGNESGETYNRFSSAGAKVSKSKEYYLEQKGWYYIYHKSTCTELDGGGITFTDNPYHSVESCVEAGAYACPVCIKNGAYAPEYVP